MTDFETLPAGTADLVKRLRECSSDEAMWSRQAADHIEQLEAALTRANAATAAAYEVVKGVRDSRNHFEQKAASQKSRVTRLRHRQRALISALETIRSTTSLADAKFQANIAIGGWADENLIFDARALATPDQTAALDRLIAEAVAPYVDALIWCSGSPDFNDGGFARKGWLKLCAPLIDPSKKGGV